MFNVIIRCILYFILGAFPFCIFADAPLPALPSVQSLFPQAQNPKSNISLKMLPELRKQLLTTDMVALHPKKNVNSKHPQKIYISRLSFEGNTVITEKKLLSVANLQNSQTTLNELHAAINRVTDYYHKKGFLLAEAYLPVQTVKNGVVVVRITEGDVGSVALNNASKVSTKLIQAILGSHYKIGQPLQNQSSNRAILILKSMPGIKNVDASLSRGEEPGTTAVSVITTKAPTVTGSVGANNYGTQYSGKYQLTGGLKVNNLAHYGDLFGLQGGASQSNLSDNARAFWETPLGSDGLRSGLSYTFAHYQVGSSLSSLGSHGISQAATLYGNYPLYLTPLSEVNFTYSLDHRWIQAYTDSINMASPEEIDAVVLSLGGFATDTLFHKDAVNSWSIANTLGSVDIENPSNFATDQLTAQTSGGYDKMVFLLSRDQKLTEQWSLYFSGTAQWSSKNLDPTEQFALGGPTAVRAYPTGEAGGDEGMLGSIEFRNQLRSWLQLVLFYDEGKIYYNKDPFIDQSNTRVISGPGIGANINWKKLTVNTSLAERLNGPATADTDLRPRFWISAQYSFE